MKTDMCRQDESIRKTKIATFSTNVDIINVKLCSRRNDDEHGHNWYKMDEIKAFRRDANMISLAFLKQKRASGMNINIDWNHINQYAPWA